MKVICIDDHDVDGFKVELTPGKIYDVRYHHKNREEAWAIKNDAGIQRWYYNDVLIPLEKWREKRLNEILN